jgi:hypothetical protein
MSTPFGKPRLVPDLPPEPVRWLIEGLLPHGDLALLDGPSGVGKSLLAAAFAAEVTRTPFAQPKDAPRVIWFGDVTSFNQDAYPALHRHRFEEGFLIHAPIHRLDVERQASVQLMWEFIAHVEAICKQFTPRLLVLDGVEDLLSFLADLKPVEVRRFYRNLRVVADNHGACILILRNSGLHQPSRLSRLGSELTPCNLVLAWHPHDPTRRVLTVAKNKRGPVGDQYHILLDEHGLATREKLTPDNHVRPGHGPAPTTWTKKKPGPTSLAPQAAARLAELLTTPHAAKDVREQLLAEGFCKYTIRTAVQLTKLKAYKQGKDWWYVLQIDSEPGALATGVSDDISTTSQHESGESCQNEFVLAPNPSPLSPQDDISTTSQDALVGWVEQSEAHRSEPFTQPDISTTSQVELVLTPNP